ncbi:Activating signal cointegrator 1 [Linum perenne]
MRGGGWSVGNGGGNYTNPCLTMHQPWASLLVHGIKRIEGRSWPAPLRAGKFPEQETIKAMEEFYREIYALNGITDIKFPQHYPVSRLLGCVEIVGCLKRDELASWEAIPEGVRVEGQTDFCWLCEHPQIYESAIRGLIPVECPMPVRFPLPNPSDPFSLRPGSIGALPSTTVRSEVEKSSSLIAAIDSARAAATQYTMKSQNHASNSIANSSSTKRYEWRIKTRISQGSRDEEPVSRVSNESKLQIDIQPEESS